MLQLIGAQVPCKNIWGEQSVVVSTLENVIEYMILGRPLDFFIWTFQSVNFYYKTKKQNLYV